MADDRGAVEPLLDRVALGAWWPDETVRACRGTSRLWWTLMEPIAARLFAAALRAPSFMQCSVCDACTWMPGHDVRKTIFRSCVSPPVAAWVARSLGATAPTPAPTPAPQAMCPAGCGPCPTSDMASGMGMGSVLSCVALAHSPDVLAALRRHLVLDSAYAGYGLGCAATNGNEPMARWMAESAESALADQEWRDEWIPNAIREVSTVGIARFLGQRFDLRSACRDGRWELREAGRAALVRAARAGDAAVCVALHAEIGFWPIEIGDVFCALVLTDDLEMAQWLVDHIGVLHNAVTRDLARFLVERATDGDVAKLEWLVTTLGLQLGDWFNSWGKHVIERAAKAGRVPVLAWVVARFGVIDFYGVMCMAARLGHLAVVEWAAVQWAAVACAATRDGQAGVNPAECVTPLPLDRALCALIDAEAYDAMDELMTRHSFDWASLGTTQSARRLRLERVCSHGAIRTVQFIERLRITSGMVEYDDD
jgi:hypothetical protein